MFAYIFYGNLATMMLNQAVVALNRYITVCFPINPPFTVSSLLVPDAQTLRPIALFLFSLAPGTTSYWLELPGSYLLWFSWLPCLGFGATWDMIQERQLALSLKVVIKELPGSNEVLKLKAIRFLNIISFRILYSAGLTIPTVIILFCYLRIFITFMRSSRRIRKKSQELQSTLAQKEVNFKIFLVFIICTFLQNENRKGAENSDTSNREGTQILALTPISGSRQDFSQDEPSSPRKKKG